MPEGGTGVHQAKGGGKRSEGGMSGGAGQSAADPGDGQAGFREGEEGPHQLHQEFGVSAAGNLAADGGSVLCARSG